MEATRMFLWGIGVLLILGALVMLFFETGLAAWIPWSIAVAGLLLVLGLLFVGFSKEAPHGERRAGGSTHVEEHHH